MTQYINKAALVAEILRRRKAIPKEEDKRLKAVYGNEAFVLTELLSFIDTLEVKEVDLDNNMTDINFEEEIDTFMYGTRNPERFPDSVQVRDKHTGLRVLDWKCYVNNPKHKIDFAKYFYELGLKAVQKGE